MGKGFISTMNRISRDLERSARAHQRQIAANQREQLRAVRDAERAQRAYERASREDEKERKRLYIESRQAFVQSKNEELDQSIDSLESILVDGLDGNPAIDFSSLKKVPEHPPLSLGELAVPLAPPVWAAFEPPKLGGLKGLLPWVRSGHQRQMLEAKAAFDRAQRVHQDNERRREERVQQLRKRHADEKAALEREASEHNSAVEAFEKAFHGGDPEAVASYFVTVLGCSPYPNGFPQTAVAQYQTESRQLVVAYDLPTYDSIVPTQKAFKYVKASDSITETLRAESQRRAIYASVVAQTVLRSMHEIFGSDTAGFVDTIVFNGYVSTIDRGTGKPMRPCLVTVRSSRDVFEDLDLEHVDAAACLRALNASVSKNAAELAPVRPVLELSMSDPRFIAEEDVISTLDQRPNLMELTPGEFESLITNLFQTMGLETRQTQASRDGGVDCVAFDPRPIFGGKVVIQAKRYKNTVGVSAVRDLFGTMQNEGASKGILVTTSGYGKAAFDFANGKPIELLSGSNLLYLLQVHAQIEAKIVMPDDWKDVSGDVATVLD